MRGFEPSTESLAIKQIAGTVVNPLFYVYQMFPTPETGGLVCQFQHITILRKNRDSNPRYLSVCRFSRPVHSTTLPFFLYIQLYVYIKIFFHCFFYELLLLLYTIVSKLMIHRLVLISKPS